MRGSTASSAKAGADTVRKRSERTPYDKLGREHTIIVTQLIRLCREEGIIRQHILLLFWLPCWLIAIQKALFKFKGHAVRISTRNVALAEGSSNNPRGAECGCRCCCCHVRKASKQPQQRQAPSFTGTVGIHYARQFRME